MTKSVIIAGILGAVVLMVWTLVVNGFLGLQARIDMKRIDGERQVYEVLKEHIVEPGRYSCNPAVTSEGRFPEGEPVFSVMYGGVGHEAAGRFMLVGFAVFIISPIIAAWLLSQASERVLSSYPRKVAFFVAIGFLFAIFSDLMDIGIGGYPPGDALILAANHIVVWTLVGLAVAWRIKPRRAEPATGVMS